MDAQRMQLRIDEQETFCTRQITNDGVGWHAQVRPRDALVSVIGLLRSNLFERSRGMGVSGADETSMLHRHAHRARVFGGVIKKQIETAIDVK
jgi:hypothetical protein